MHNHEWLMITLNLLQTIKSHRTRKIMNKFTHVHTHRKHFPFVSGQLRFSQDLRERHESSLPFILSFFTTVQYFWSLTYYKCVVCWMFFICQLSLSCHFKMICHQNLAVWLPLKPNGNTCHHVSVVNEEEEVHQKITGLWGRSGLLVF